LREGFLTSAAANVTLFHASLENSEPTIAAPKATIRVDVSVHSPLNAPPAKFAVIASALRPSVSPRRISSASAPVLTTVSVV
jgi:hypothetical protein